MSDGKTKSAAVVKVEHYFELEAWCELCSIKEEVEDLCELEVLCEQFEHLIDEVPCRTLYAGDLQVEKAKKEGVKFDYANYSFEVVNEEYSFDEENWSQLKFIQGAIDGAAYCELAERLNALMGEAKCRTYDKEELPVEEGEVVNG